MLVQADALQIPLCPRGHKKIPRKGKRVGQWRCRTCENEQRRAWRAANLEEARRIGRRQQRKRRKRDPQRVRDEQWAMMLMREYGITVQQYHALYEEQGGCCAICHSLDPRHASGRWVVDHNHKTGAVRGLLCGWCNSALGYLRDNPDAAVGIINYLKREEG